MAKSKVLTKLETMLSLVFLNSLLGKSKFLLFSFLSSPIWMIYSHGNACDIGEMAQDMEIYRKFFKVNIICYEYPGYGTASGSPTPEGCIAYQKTIFNFITKYLKIPQKNVVLFGRSIGSGITSALCLKLEKKNPNSLGGLILQRFFVFFLPKFFFSVHTSILERWLKN